MDLVNLHKLKEALLGFIKIKIELLKLDITEHLSKVLSRVIAFLIIFITSMFALVFVCLAFANYLNDLWGNSFGGYLVLAGIYTAIFIFIIYLLKSGKLKAYIEADITSNISEED